MVCHITCTLAIMFICAHLAVLMFSGNIKQEFIYELRKGARDIEHGNKLVAKYCEIVNNRKHIYATGFVLGLIISIVLLPYAVMDKQGDSGNSLHAAGFVAGITFGISYLYYMFACKKDYMITYLHNPAQRKAWLRIRQEMMMRYHIGLVVGLIASAMLGVGLTSESSSPPSGAGSSNEFDWI